jgi:hypothetical protein
MPDYEIDHGEPVAERLAAPPAPVSSAADDAEDARLRAAIPAAAARLAAAPRRGHLVDMWALGVALLCGQGLSGIARIETWTGTVFLGLLISLGGLAVVAWMWRRSRLPADTLASLPILLDDRTDPRAALRSDVQRAAERGRRSEELALIELTDDALSLHLERLRLALYGAAAGTLGPWICAWTAPTGLTAMAGSCLAIPGALLGWRVAAGGWNGADLERWVLIGLPGGSFIAALWVGAHWMWAGVGQVLVAAAVWWQRPRISALATRS